MFKCVYVCALMHVLYRTVRIILACICMRHQETYAHTHTHTYTHVYTSTHTHTHTHTHICVCIYIYICVCVYIYIYTYIHTYIQTLRLDADPLDTVHKEKERELLRRVKESTTSLEKQNAVNALNLYRELMQVGHTPTVRAIYVCVCEWYVCKI
jgi:hypothetical protein